jgi:hypothetical protein
MGTVDDVVDRPKCIYVHRPAPKAILVMQIIFISPHSVGNIMFRYRTAVVRRSLTPTKMRQVRAIVAPLRDLQAGPVCQDEDWDQEP